MKGLICYYSGTGNTKLVCQYLAKKVNTVQFDLFDIAKDGAPELAEYDIVGFAAFADFFKPSYLMQQFCKGISQQNGKPAFVLNTYGAISGKTLPVLGQWVTDRGFSVVTGHSLHTPENFPPMIARGMSNETAPSEKEMQAFNLFIADLNSICQQTVAGETVTPRKLPIGFVSKVLGTIMNSPRTKARDDMGEKFVDEALCNECGLCAKVCPYKAIVCDPKPVFDMKKCYGCWSCYNHCQQKAIYTKKFRGRAHYPNPLPALKEKLQ